MSRINLDDYSPSSTIVAFDAPLPLLRGPAPSADPSSGPFVLAFASQKSFFAAYESCESKLKQQCNAGARIGCSIAASEKCGPRWWEALFGRRTVDCDERRRCEELEMEGCLAVAENRCGVFAKEKCLGPFRDARVAVEGREAGPEVLGWVCMAGRNEVVDLMGVRKVKAWCSTKCLTETQCLRGSVLLGLELNVEQRK
uniref:Uncharacterized protein n=1 Tax=Kalanchoe fedtschenkoi TaxID=63787 RepID=A0A7N0SY59_KALFE